MFNIAFIGFYQMGMPIAMNLIKGGHNINVFDTSSDAINNMLAKGCCSNMNCGSGSQCIINNYNAS